MTKIEVKPHGRDQFAAAVPGKENSYVVFWQNSRGETGFAVKWKVENNYHYQHLMLSCRAMAESYVKPAAELYRHLKKNKLTRKYFCDLSGLKYFPKQFNTALKAN